MPTHQCERRVRHRRQPVEQVPAALDQFAPFFGGVELREFLDVSTGDEAGVLARTEDQPLRRAAVELIEQL
jgi:hypothetical protein